MIFNTISDLERQPDGRYVGVITIYQRLKVHPSETGYLNYKDTTKKRYQPSYVEKKQNPNLAVEPLILDDHARRRWEWLKPQLWELTLILLRIFFASISIVPGARLRQPWDYKKMTVDSVI